MTGERVAPVLTIFIGGNHEASNMLQSLYYGGWVAPNIYFLGYGGVVWYNGLRIAGLSGIYNQRHYNMGHYETFPYSDDELRSVYHIRELEIYRMQQMQSSHVDIFLSHDWPNGIWNYGDLNQLLRVKPYFKDDIETGKLGSPPLMHILQILKPSFWFAAHLHVKFPAVVPHISNITTAVSPSFMSSSNPGPSASFTTAMEGNINGDSSSQSNLTCALDGNKEEDQSSSHDNLLSETKIVSFADVVREEVKNKEKVINKPVNCTRFLALDKVLSGR